MAWIMQALSEIPGIIDFLSVVLGSDKALFHFVDKEGQSLLSDA